MKKVFIDGKAGTTGLRIYERLEKRTDIRLLTLSESDRKVIGKRAEMLNDCDVAFLCLPDEAAIEAVGLVQNPTTVVIDTSTAHRTDPEWVYGYPEIVGRDKITVAKRIANPGCHAIGFVSLVAPLTSRGILSKSAELCCHSITGYSGGGKKMIAAYEEKERSSLFSYPRQYGLSQMHKHLKEMKAVGGLLKAPIFCPIVADFYSGMEVTVMLPTSVLESGYSVKDIKDAYRESYEGPFVKYVEDEQEDGFLSAGALSGRDKMHVGVYGNEDRILLVARFDNLGIGASGEAIRCMNLVLGTEETEGLLL